MSTILGYVLMVTVWSVAYVLTRPSMNRHREAVFVTVLGFVIAPLVLLAMLKVSGS